MVRWACMSNALNLLHRLVEIGQHSEHCAVYEQFGKASDDADVLLVQTSLQIADTYATVMIAEYTDLLVLLYKAHSHEIAMMSISYLDEPTPAIFRDAKKTPVRVCATTFFSHMLMGQCDTTARLYDISKNVPLKRYICRWHVHAEREELLGHDCRNHFNCWWAIMLSWRYRDETLYHLRYSGFPRKVSTDKTAVIWQAVYYPHVLAYLSILVDGFRAQSRGDHGWPPL